MLMVILPVTGGQSGKLTDVFHTQQGHRDNNHNDCWVSLKQF